MASRVEVPSAGVPLADIRVGVGLAWEPFTPSNARERRLAEAWASLASVRRWGAGTLTSVLIVVIEAPLVDEKTADALPPIDAVILTNPRPTAAHPRAYLGTTYKPPKPKSPRPLDIRQHLFDNVSIGEILRRLDSHWDEAVNALTEEGYVPPEPKDVRPPGGSAPSGGNNPFLMLLLPRLKGAPNSSIRRVLEVYNRQRLVDRLPIVLGFAAMLERKAPSAAVAGWAEIMEGFAVDQHEGFVELLLRTGACAVDPAVAGEELDDLLHEVIDDRDSAYRVFAVLNAVARGVDLGYLRGGFHLSDRLYPDRSRDFARCFHDVGASGYFPEREVMRIADHFRSSNIFGSWYLSRLWEVCAKAEDVGVFVERRNLTRWMPKVTEQLLELYLMPFAFDDLADVKARWKALSQAAETIDESLTALSEDYRVKFCRFLNGVIRFIELSTLTPCTIPDACRMAARVSRAPFDPEAEPANVWTDYIAHCSPDQIDRLLDAPDAVFAQLEKARRSDNVANLIGWGTWALTKRAPAFALASMVGATKRLLRVVRVLGCLSQEERLLAVDEFMLTSAMNIDTDLLDDEHAYVFIDAHEERMRTRSIPGVLRDHFEGSRPLNGPRLSHYIAQMRRQWLRGCLDLLEDSILTRLSMVFSLLEIGDCERHALQFVPRTEENRRALRRFLAAHWAGNSNYLMTHPLTRQWLAAHPAVDVDIWSRGVTLAADTEAHGSVTIAIEQDPIEALRLGTYAGSCLGVGGILQYSAAATVLDINKQVAYARDSRGNVVGRQVVAISETEEIVCFEVYPSPASDELLRAFAEFDRRLSAAVGLPIFMKPAEVEGEYNIALIVSNAWYDNGHWDLSVDSCADDMVT